MRLKSSLASLAVVISTAVAYGQEAVAYRPSPLTIAACRYKDTYLKLTYSQPHKRGREIFGKLVPWGEVWRTGANEATELTITRDVFVNNQLLPAGTYSLFTIPNPTSWTIIINKDVGLWGAYNYNPLMDVFRFDVPAHAIEGPAVYEPFTIQIEQRNNKADVLFLWDKTKISFPIDFIEPKP